MSHPARPEYRSEGFRPGQEPKSSVDLPGVVGTRFSRIDHDNHKRAGQVADDHVPADHHEYPNILEHPAHWRVHVRNPTTPSSVIRTT